VVIEVIRIWDARVIGCLLSIGTGRIRIRPIPDSHPKLHEVVETMTDIATDSDAIARRFRDSDRGKALADEGRYYRFNVEHEMEEVELSDATKIQHMRDCTEPYVKDQASGLESGGKLLVSSHQGAIS
jgi:hypothetical protein